MGKTDKSAVISLTGLGESAVTRQISARISVRTAGQGMTELTAAIGRWLADRRCATGLLTIFCRHTSASLTIQENADPDVRADILAALDALAPRHRHYRHAYEGPDDMPAHIRTMLTGSSLCVPVSGGALALGTWQGIYLIEHRDRSHERHAELHYVGN